MVLYGHINNSSRSYIELPDIECSHVLHMLILINFNPYNYFDNVFYPAAQTPRLRLREFQMTLLCLLP